LVRLRRLWLLGEWWLNFSLCQQELPVPLLNLLDKLLVTVIMHSARYLYAELVLLTLLQELEEKRLIYFAAFRALVGARFLLCGLGSQLEVLRLSPEQKIRSF